jgi:shikimate dehydrogenase
MPMTSPALQDIIALFGCPAAGNPAQYLFEHGIERAIEQGGLDWRFVSVDVAVERLGEALAGAAAMGFRGCLLDGSLRIAALPLVSATPAAAFAGAASLVDRGADGWVAHMTDGRGIVEAVRSHVEPAERRVLIVGAGPCGRAAALEFAMAGAAGIVVSDPDETRVESLVASLRALETAATVERASWPKILVPEDVRIVVSSFDQPVAEMALEHLRPDLVVAEAVLSPEPASVGRQALAAGACLVDGLEIHATRAAIDFRQITGLAADADLLRDALDEFLSAP